MDAGGRTEPVEVRYTPTAADFRAAFAARDRGTVAGRRVRRKNRVLAGCAAAGAVLLTLASGAVRVQAVALAAIALVVAVGLPWLRLRRVMRMVADKGEFRVVLDEVGVTVSNAVSVMPLAWREQPYYLETPELFVLLGGDEETHVLTVLPKRGTPDRRLLGELIARHASV
ncbi:hypothetical protein, partial [Streptomyces sp. FH025]|uniref:hypothetical protein n=1 Tax=Streptomyces sp. FH025 TaxID=2815937 RepID=UPI001A9FA885